MIFPTGVPGDSRGGPTGSVGRRRRSAVVRTTASTIDLATDAALRASPGGAERGSNRALGGYRVIPGGPSANLRRVPADRLVSSPPRADPAEAGLIPRCPGHRFLCLRHPLMFFAQYNPPIGFANGLDRRGHHLAQSGLFRSGEPCLGRKPALVR